MMLLKKIAISILLPSALQKVVWNQDDIICLLCIFLVNIPIFRISSVLRSSNKEGEKKGQINRVFPIRLVWIPLFASTTQRHTYVYSRNDGIKQQVPLRFRRFFGRFRQSQKFNFERNCNFYIYIYIFTIDCIGEKGPRGSYWFYGDVKYKLRPR